MDLFWFKGSYISHIGRRSESHSAVFYAFFHDTFHIPEAFSLNTATADINQISNASGQCSVIPVSTFSAVHLSTFTIHLTSPCEFSNCLIRAHFSKKRFTQKWNPVVGYSPPHRCTSLHETRRWQTGGMFKCLFNIQYRKSGVIYTADENCFKQGKAHALYTKSYNRCKMYSLPY